MSTGSAVLCVACSTCSTCLGAVVLGCYSTALCCFLFKGKGVLAVVVGQLLAMYAAADEIAASCCMQRAPSCTANLRSKGMAMLPAVPQSYALCSWQVPNFLVFGLCQSAFPARAPLP
jgi:hypothetical protein